MKLSYDIEYLEELAKRVLKNTSTKIVCFYGSMGVGKTTLIRKLIQELEAIDIGNSPTFGIVNEYHDRKGEVLAYHFDFYRVESEEEALDLGLEDYFASNVWIFIEWPEKIANLLPPKHTSVKLHFIDETTRSIEF
ncbi:MAG: tRNA (adenosine(37)-N6)-threonylcarbamoyltransferase complex ATPase subunit type 1 TsaE [Bacteroidota bacterium]